MCLLAIPLVFPEHFFEFIVIIVIIIMVFREDLKVFFLQNVQRSFTTTVNRVYVYRTCDGFFKRLSFYFKNYTCKKRGNKSCKVTYVF